MANQTYDKYKKQIERIKGLIIGYEAYVNRYMKNGIKGHEYEYKGAIEDLINDIKDTIK